jgi:integrase/recombinase XerD
MRTVLFPPHFGDRYDQSPAADWLRSFAAWLKTMGYNETTQKGHVMALRLVLERQPRLPPDARFGAVELDPMFHSQIRPTQFRHVRWAFEQFLRSKKQWIDRPRESRHDRLLDSYREHLQSLLGLARSTVSAKISFARRFLESTCPIDDGPSRIGIADVERYIVRRSRQIGRGGLKNELATVRSFLKFCASKDICRSHLAEVDFSVKFVGDKPPRAIPWKHVRRLLGSIDRSTPMGCRDHAALHLMARYGLRTGEVTSITVDDLDLKAGRLRVRQAKVKSILVLPIRKETRQLLSHYLRTARPKCGLPELFVSVQAPTVPFSRNAIAQAFRRHAERSGLPLRNSSPYGLRHAFASQLLERGVGMPAIGQLLGHRTIESTSQYLRIHTSALRDVALPVP